MLTSLLGKHQTNPLLYVYVNLCEHSICVCLHGLAPSYLAAVCVLASAAASRRHLRSGDTVELLVRQSRTVISARDFLILAATIWNNLPRLSSC